MELEVIDNKGKKSSSVNFDESLLPEKAKKALLHEIVVAHLAGQRAGTHSAKTRSEVSGGGAKPWRQKGTGRARAGSIRSPLWRHGGVIFATKPRSYNQNLPKKKKRLAFKMAIKSLIDSNRIQIVEPIKLSEPKTSLVASVYKKWKTPTNSLFVTDKLDSQFVRAARNIRSVEFKEAESLNTYDCLKARRVYVTAPALEKISARLAKSVER